MSARLEVVRLRSMFLRLAGVQATLVAGLLVVLAILRPSGLALALLLYLCLIPLIVIGVGGVYYREVAALASEGAYSKEADAKKTKKAYDRLGAALALWIVGLVALWIYA